LGGRLQCRAVVLRVPADVDRLVPRLERVRVEDQVEQLAGGPAPGHCSSSSHARIASACSPSAGGGRWSLRVTSSPVPSKNRRGGPGSRSDPRVLWSTSISRPWLCVWSHP